MPDISMCSGVACPLAEGCYRHRAVPDEWRQSWMLPPPYDPVTKTCDAHWPKGARTNLRPFKEGGDAPADSVR